MTGRRWMELAVAGAIAGAVVACGDQVMDAGGTMLQDAGAWMQDAGEALADAGMSMGGEQVPGAGDGDMMQTGGQMLRDAGRAVVDAGHSALRDAGSQLVDAGRGMRDAGATVQDAGASLRDAGQQMAPDAASAQACNACSLGGVQRIMLASEDPDQVLGGTIQGSGWTEVKGTPLSPTVTVCSEDLTSRGHIAELGSGPFVVADMLHLAGDVSLFAVPVGQPCFVESSQFTVGSQIGCDGGSGYVNAYEMLPPPTARTILTLNSGRAITGARIPVRAGETLCALDRGGARAATESTSLSATGSFLWSGFALYD